MQVEIVHGGMNQFRSTMYPQQDHRTVQFLHNQIESVLQQSTTLNPAAKEFYQEVSQRFDSHFGEEAMRLAKAAELKSQLLFEKDDIRHLSSLAQFQNAKPKMQRFIMANPEIRQKYHQQRISGYTDSYIDPQPGIIGSGQYDYRRAMDGIMTEEKDGSFSFTCYYEDLHELDTPLDIVDKNAILNTWDHITNLLRQGEEDPTDPLNGKL